jgi:hypothetical protein
MSSPRKQELKLRVEAKISELSAQLATVAADGTAEAQKRKDQIETSLKEAQAHLKGGWEKITDQASSKLNQWPKG